MTLAQQHARLATSMQISMRICSGRTAMKRSLTTWQVLLPDRDGIGYTTPLTDRGQERHRLQQYILKRACLAWLSGPAELDLPFAPQGPRRGRFLECGYLSE